MSYFSAEEYELWMLIKRLGGTKKVKEFLESMEKHNVKIDALQKYLESMDYKVPNPLEARISDLERRILELEKKLFTATEEREEEKKIPGRYILRREFWQGLLEKSNKKIDLFAKRSPTNDCWLGTGRKGFYYVYVILMDRARVELIIDTGDKERNKRYFDVLYQNKERIEEDFGEKLEWQRLNEKRLCRVSKSILDGGLRNRELWETLQDKMVDAMVRLHKALDKHIRTLS